MDRWTMEGNHFILHLLKYRSERYKSGNTSLAFILRKINLILYRGTHTICAVKIFRSNQRVRNLRNHLRLSRAFNDISNRSHMFPRSQISHREVLEGEGVKLPLRRACFFIGQQAWKSRHSLSLSFKKKRIRARDKTRCGPFPPMCPTHAPSKYGRRFFTRNVNRTSWNLWRSRILQSYFGSGPVSSSARFMSTSRGRNISRAVHVSRCSRFQLSLSRRSNIRGYRKIFPNFLLAIQCSKGTKLPPSLSPYFQNISPRDRESFQTFLYTIEGERESIVESILRGCQRLVPAGGNKDIIRGLPNLAGDHPLRPL